MVWRANLSSDVIEILTDVQMGSKKLAYIRYDAVLHTSLEVRILIEVRSKAIGSFLIKTIIQDQ